LLCAYTGGMEITLPELVAHRGYALRYPENTLIALDAAVAAGATYLEFDILLSADQVPVLFHDRDLQRMCGKPGAVHEHTLAQLKSFSVSEFEKFGYRYAGNRITTLQETVEFLATKPGVLGFVEIKRQSLEIFGVDKVLDAVLPLLGDIPHQAVIISYSIDALRAVRERSGYPIGAVFDHWRERKQILLQSLRPEYLFTDIDELPRFGRLKQSNTRLAVYECADPKRALQVHRRGVDLVETFAIAEMREQLILGWNGR
jgi:glycerophosphoryl diester phosphodiesterase